MQGELWRQALGAELWRRGMLGDLWRLGVRGESWGRKLGDELGLPGMGQKLCWRSLRGKLGGRDKLGGQKSHDELRVMHRGAYVFIGLALDRNVNIV